MNANLLIVDDDPAIRLLFSDYFAGIGWRVDAASEKEEGLALLTCCEYQAVVSDLRLSRHSLSDGLEIINFARARFPAALIVACTGYGDADLSVQARHNGASEVILKPVPLAALDRIFRRQG